MCVCAAFLAAIAIVALLTIKKRVQKMLNNAQYMAFQLDSLQLLYTSVHTYVCMCQFACVAPSFFSFCLLAFNFFLRKFFLRLELVNVLNTLQVCTDAR